MLWLRRRERIARTADSWAARSIGGLSADERAERDGWRAADLAHETAWRQAQALVHATDGIRRPRAAASTTPAARPLWRPAIACVAVIVAAGGAFYAERGRFGLSGQSSTHYAAVSAPSHLRLDDGTIVDLDSGGAIRANFSGPVRAVRLERGTARFKVAHDKVHPFVVTAADRQVTAIGTRFEVALRQHGVIVTLFQGAVEVAARHAPAAHRPVQLKPGQRLTVENGQETLGDGPAIVSTSGPHDVPATPAAAIVAAANRATTMPIRFSDPALGSRAIQGRLDTRDTAALAAQIGAALGLEVHRTDSGYLLSPR
jgi:transmembrane sensor